MLGLWPNITVITGQSPVITAVRPGGPYKHTLQGPEGLVITPGAYGPRRAYKEKGPEGPLDCITPWPLGPYGPRALGHRAYGPVLTLYLGPWPRVAGLKPCNK